MTPEEKIINAIFGKHTSINDMQVEHRIVENTPLNGPLGICVYTDTTKFNKGDKVKIIIIRECI